MRGRLLDPIEDNFARFESYGTGPDILKISRRPLSNALPHGFRVVLEVYTSTKTSELNMVSSAYAEPCGGTNLTKSKDFFAEPNRAKYFLEGRSNASNLTDFDAIVSAMKIHTTLKKISTKTVYYEKS